MKEVVCAGSGGQGVLTCGLILSDIAVREGQNATWCPSYGSAMRGGPAKCTVKFGTDVIYNPQQEEPDVLIVMNNPSFEMFIKIVAPNGMAVVGDMVTCDTTVRPDVTIVKVPCSAIADELGNARSANIVMTGAAVKAMGDFSKEEAIAAMNAMFAKKGKSKFEEANKKAFEAGYAAV